MTATAAGQVIDPDGQPVSGAPVQWGRFPSQTDTTGRFSIRGRFSVWDRNLIAWPSLAVGDSRRDIPWRTQWFRLSALSDPVVVQPRGFVTGHVEYLDGSPAGGRRLCAAEPRPPFRLTTVYVATDICAVTDGSGDYRLRVDGPVQVFIDEESFTSQELLDTRARYLRADPYPLADGRDMNSYPRLDAGVGALRNDPDAGAVADVGGTVNLVIPKVAPGPPVTVRGTAPEPGTTVCAATLADVTCAPVSFDPLGTFDLRVPTLVERGHEHDPVNVTLSLGPTQTRMGAVDRFAAAPGTSVHRAVAPAQWAMVRIIVPEQFAGACIEAVDTGADDNVCRGPLRFRQDPAVRQAPGRYRIAWGNDPTTGHLWRTDTGLSTREADAKIYPLAPGELLTVSVP